MQKSSTPDSSKVIRVENRRLFLRLWVAQISLSLYLSLIFLRTSHRAGLQGSTCTHRKREAPAHTGKLARDWTLGRGLKVVYPTFFRLFLHSQHVLNLSGRKVQLMKTKRCSGIMIKGWITTIFYIWRNLVHPSSIGTSQINRLGQSCMKWVLHDSANALMPRFFFSFLGRSISY